jgi:hypothetical protein
MSDASNARRSVSKRLRFEVFKRDSFKCQYCGATAPEVVLHVDHIRPRATGGGDEIINLITSCLSCNLGKGVKALSDNTTVVKTRSQLEELQDRREQLEMMMQWREGLRDLSFEAVDKVSNYWADLAPGFVPSEVGRRNLGKWIRHYSVDEVIQAMDVAADRYLQFEQQDRATGESWELAFSKIPAICRVNRESAENPDLKELFYIRAIVRNRCKNYFDAGDCIERLKNARMGGIPVQELRRIAVRISYYREFTEMLDELLSEYEDRAPTNSGLGG